MVAADPSVERVRVVRIGHAKGIAMAHVSGHLLRESDEVNREQREYWATEGPRQYQEYGETNEALLAPFGQAMLDAAQLQPGERVLDVGCGYGTSTLEAAEGVAPSGRVVGIDISAAMLEPARQRVAAAGVDNVALLQADAQVHPFEPASFDVVISRFGVMFFDDPEAAFANLARALRPGGRLVFACPQDPLRSEWVRIAFGAAVGALGRAPDLGPAGAPGPFALANGDRLARLLTAAGFRDVALEGVTRPVRVGHEIDQTVRFVMPLPQSQQLFTGAPKDVLGAAVEALRGAFTPYAGSNGVVMDSTAWLVSARR
jgi:SAM-dependent methyltransferase